MAYKTVVLKCDTVGAPAGAVGAADCGCPTGRVSGVQLQYDPGCPATTNVVVNAVLNGVVKPVFSQLLDNTDVPLQAVAEEAMDCNMTTLSAAVPMLVAGRLTLDVTGCDALTDAVTALLLLEVMP